MGNFAENLNLGNRFRPPLGADILDYTALYQSVVFLFVFQAFT